MDNQELICNADVYGFLLEKMGWSRVKVDRLKRKIRIKDPSVKNHPLVYRAGDWVLSVKKFNEYYIV